MQAPSRRGFQFFAMGRHGKRASMKKVKPHTELRIIIDQVHLRARRYCAVEVDVAVSAKRRRYWNRMASLMADRPRAVIRFGMNVSILGWATKCTTEFMSSIVA